jgi:hypothetical protein
VFVVRPCLCASTQATSLPGAPSLSFPQPPHPCTVQVDVHAQAQSHLDKGDRIAGNRKHTWIDPEDVCTLLWGYASWGFYSAPLIRLLTDKATQAASRQLLSTDQLARVSKRPAWPLGGDYQALTWLHLAKQCHLLDQTLFMVCATTIH